MFITGITHAGAREKTHAFRGLTQQGWGEAINAGVQFKLKVDAREGGDEEAIPAIQSLISSPKPRCLETAILFAKMVSDYNLITTADIEIDPGLQAGSIQGDELAKVASEAKSDHILVSGHADLAKALPPSVRLDPSAVEDGWFTTRPVLFTLQYDPGQPWDSAQLLFCNAFVEGEWKSLLAG